MWIYILFLTLSSLSIYNNTSSPYCFCAYYMGDTVWGILAYLLSMINLSDRYQHCDFANQGTKAKHSYETC